MRSFLVALQFLTRLPCPIADPISVADVGKSIGWFPAVGALIGLLMVAVDAMGGLVVDRAVVDALLVATLIAVTGALHIDGIVDTADGLAAGPEAHVQLAAMRQASAGPFGAVAGVATVLAAYAAISALDGPARWPGLAIAPIVGRAAILLAYSRHRYARPDLGVSRALKDGATPGRAAIGLASAILLAGAAISGGLASSGASFSPHMLIGAAGILVVAAGWTELASALITRRLGGLTGDVIGALAETSQLLSLVLAGWLLRL